MIILFTFFLFFVLAAGFMQRKSLLSLLAFFTPIYAINFNFGFTFTFSRLIIFANLLIIFLSLSTRCKNKIKLPYGFTIYIGILISQIISAFFASDYIEHFRQILIIFNCSLVLLVTFNLIEDMDDLFKALKVYVVGGGFQALVGIYQVIGFFLSLPMYQDYIYTGDLVPGNDRNLMGVFYSNEDSFPRAYGFLSDPNVFGIYMVTVIFCAAILVKYKFIVNIAKICICLALFGIILALSRSSMMTLLISFFIYVMIRFSLVSRSALQFKTHTNSLMGTFFFLIIILTGVTATTDLGDVVMGRVLQFFEGDRGSYLGHVSTRLQGIELFMQHPLFGSGLDYNADPKVLSDGSYFGGSHAFWLDMLVASGIFGLFMWILFIFANISFLIKIIKKLNRLKNQESIFIMLIFCTLFITLFMANFMYHSFPNDFVWFLIGLFSAGGRVVYFELRENIKIVGKHDGIDYLQSRENLKMTPPNLIRKIYTYPR